MVHCMYQRVYQCPYTPGHKVKGTTNDESPIHAPASGCKGHSSLRSSTPCPSAFPSPTARSSLGWDARSCSLSRMGRGSAPCTRGPRADRRWRIGEAVPSKVCVIWPSHCLHSTQGSVCSPCSGASSDAYISVPLCFMSQWIEHGLYRMFGWWRWKRRFRNSQLSLNAFSGDRLRIVVSEPINGGEHHLHLERLSYDKQWRRFGSVAENEFPELLELLVNAGNLIHPGSFRFVKR
jgi:hypothetical protein